jgi:hypothetical protein
MMRCDDILRDSAVIALLTATAGNTLSDSLEEYNSESQATLMSILADRRKLFIVNGNKKYQIARLQHLSSEGGVW